jgi:hypothetical protein
MAFSGGCEITTTGSGWPVQFGGTPRYFPFCSRQVRGGWNAEGSRFPCRRPDQGAGGVAVGGAAATHGFDLLTGEPLGEQLLARRASPACPPRQDQPEPLAFTHGHGVDLVLRLSRERPRACTPLPFLRASAACWCGAYHRGVHQRQTQVELAQAPDLSAGRQQLQELLSHDTWRGVGIMRHFPSSTGHEHPYFRTAINSYACCFQPWVGSEAEIWHACALRRTSSAK